MADLQRQLNVRARYQNADADFLSRFPAPFRERSFENFFKYYLKMIDVAPDPESGVAVVEVRAFRAQDARDINARLLSLSEDLVNRSERACRAARHHRGGAARCQAQVRVRKARVALSAFRNTQDLIDPTKQATGVLEISNKLVSEHAALQAQLDLMRSVAPANPSIPALKARLSALGAEIAAQNARVVGSQRGIASKVGGYENLMAEQEFAQQTLTAAEHRFRAGEGRSAETAVLPGAGGRPEHARHRVAAQQAARHFDRLRSKPLPLFHWVDVGRGHSGTLSGGLSACEVLPPDGGFNDA